MNATSTRPGLSECRESKGSDRSGQAEFAYLFRHALLRDVAYQLQLPGDRARLHSLAFALIEELVGGRPSMPPPLAITGAEAPQAHASDPLAHELAEHARLAQHGEGTGSEAMLGAQRLYARRAAEHASRHFQNQTAVQRWQQYAELVVGVERGESLRRAALTAHHSGKSKQAESLLEEALAVHRQAGERRAQGKALENLALLYAETGRVERAEAVYEEAMAIHREVGNRVALGSVMGNLSNLYRESGRAELAERSYEEALRIHRETGIRRDEAISLANVGILYKSTGRFELAERSYEQALAIYREMDARQLQCIVLVNLAGLYEVTGRLEQSERLFTEALKVQREVGFRRPEGVALNGLAEVYRDTGRPALAEETFELALRIHIEVGNRRSEGVTRGNLANLYRDSGRFPQADLAFREAISIHREVGNRPFLGLHLCDHTVLRLLQGNPVEAREMWDTGAAVLRELGNLAGLESKLESMRSACSRAGIPPLELPAP